MLRKYLVDIVHEAVTNYHRIWTNENYYTVKDDANARRLFFADIRIKCQRQEINELHNKIIAEKMHSATLRKALNDLRKEIEITSKSVINKVGE